ncbi:MAG: hypothetical protein K2P40_13840 [Lachnospiraceae bacterium]|nr:hypothetical protein [Lachnospiraceae bacterium]MDE6942008.1 hypothetical protein [Lachnospiraceae bacterium]
MKNFKFKQILMMLALVIIVQNGAVIVSNTVGDNGSYSDEGGTAPCSDLPPIDDSYD